MRANSTETIYYLYDREDRIGDYDENGNLMIAYTHGPGIDEPVALTINGNTYFYIPDIQGSIRAIIDINGNAVATYQYDAWGNLFSYNGTLAQHNDYLYTGREYDWQTGIYYYRARYYNPELGRFLSQDPAGMVDGPNMYVYVKNEPVNGVDAWGRFIFYYTTYANYVEFFFGICTLHERWYPSGSSDWCYHRSYYPCTPLFISSLCVDVIQRVPWELQSASTCRYWYMWYWSQWRGGGGHGRFGPLPA